MDDSSVPLSDPPDHSSDAPEGPTRYELPSEAEMVSIIAKIRDFHRFIMSLEDVDPKVLHEEVNPTELSVRLANIYDATRFLFETTVLSQLLQDARWEKLAGRPGRFRRELDEVLSRIRTYMMARYGLKSHRPTRNEKRDAQIYYRFKAGKKLSEIGSKFGISRGTAQRAVERHEERQRQAIESGREVLRFPERHMMPLYEAARKANPAKARPPL